MASLCNSCSRYHTCKREVTITEERVLLGNGECVRCTDHKLLTQADFAEKDAEIAELKKRTVAVPEWDVNKFALKHVQPGSYFEHDVREAFRWAEIGYKHAVANAVSPSRVVGDDQVAVNRVRLEQLGAIVTKMDELAATNKPVGKLPWAALDHFNALTDPKA